ncbi:MAG: DUF2304 family protein [Myxococcales bacterium]
MIYLAYVLFAVYVLTRFGRVISASRAIPMWIVLFALGITVVDPNVLLPIAQLFGIQVVSNMVFATMLLFLLFESLKGAAEQTSATRQLRRLVARLACRDFTGQQAGRPAGSVLVVVPAYNEASSIANVVTQLAALLADNDDIDAVIVDDGSMDETARIASERANGRISVVSHAVNCGVGGVLMTAFTIATQHAYQHVVQCDADGQHPVGSIPDLVQQAAERRVDLLVGSRFCAESEKDESTTWMRRFGGRLISLSLATFGRKAQVTDPTSGFRVYSRRAAALLAVRMPDEYPEPESVAVCAIQGLSIGETPVKMLAREAGESSISGWKSAVFMVKVLTSLLSFRVRYALGRVG